jgi:CRP/FNR family transcriptional regulator, cyclic AMP receptor protein
MEAVNPRSGRNKPEVARIANSRPLVGRRVTPSSQQIFPLRPKPATGGPGTVGEGYQKLKNRLISRGLPESIIDELFEQPTLVNYGRGSFIFFQGGRTDLLFWVSSGLVDILCPGPDGEQIIASVLGPGEFFGFVESKDHKGQSAQAFQARARTNAQIGLVIRAQVFKVLAIQEPTLLVQILGEVVAAWSELTLRHAQFLGSNYAGRLETVLADLAAKFGVNESRGTLLIPAFGHSDFAEMIGCSRPMVSRLISEMISAGRLAQTGKHYIILDDFAVNIQKQG